jgi:hypothetical protein
MITVTTQNVLISQMSTSQESKAYIISLLLAGVQMALALPVQAQKKDSSGLKTKLSSYLTRISSLITTTTQSL